MTKKLFVIIGVVFFSGLLTITACRHKSRYCQDLPEKMISYMDDQMEDLNLTSAQQEKYELIKKELRADFAEHKSERKEFHAFIEKELESGEPDVKKIAQLLKKKHAEKSTYFDKYLDMAVTFYYMLDTSQRALVIEKVQKHHERFQCD